MREIVFPRWEFLRRFINFSGEILVEFYVGELKTPVKICTGREDFQR